ncbi:hypothetical protein SK128_028382 [Halocaridina rubra]|uniref:Apple domain-containing protein n=1 Tax=Halocaridina rubra TaxID=373956 RepID=A0AAN8XT20_HALRR
MTILAVSQFPVFTLYAQKLCVPADRLACSSPWAYETVPGLALTELFANETRPSDTRSQCANMCMQEKEFICRSAAFNSARKACTLSQIDRKLAGSKQLLELSEKVDYLEVSCLPKPAKLCKFRSNLGIILKTVDAAYRNVASLEECKSRCENSDFTCYSYDFNSTGENICRVSHHSSATLAHIQEPYMVFKNATTYEMEPCFQVSLECKGAEMLAKISTSTVFDGKVYVKDKPNSCVKDIRNAIDFEIVLPYNDINCDVVQEGPGNFSSNIVIQVSVSQCLDMILFKERILFEPKGLLFME